ncbi:MAG: polyphosphate kinase, partial [Actinomycetota bacterium]|nr:polyphosphate kinase [Actinomycetota bacterium]
MTYEIDLSGTPGERPAPAWAPPDTDGVAGKAPPYLNRQLSWLDYGARVLCQAEDPSVPLLERAKFLAIFSQNLDEFFQVRVAGLKDQVEAGLGATGADGLGPEEQLAAIRLKVSELLERQYTAFVQDIVPSLADAGIGLSDWASLDDDDRAYLVGVFEERIFPVLTPLCVDPAHPFPEISNLSLNQAVVVRNPVTGERRFARVKVPPLLPRFVVMSDGERFVALEQVIAAHLSSLFVGMEIEGQYSFRVTRNADLTLEEDEADDLLAAVELELRRRRFGEAVRLEIDRHASPEIRDLLIRELEIEPDDVYDIDGPLDLGGLWSVWELDRRELKDEA